VRLPYAPVERASDLPKFCGRCGRAMVTDDHVHGYDRATGAALVMAAVRCPKGRFDNGHEAFEVSPRPGRLADSDDA
jgi:hypothetical protein